MTRARNARAGRDVVRDVEVLGDAARVAEVVERAAALPVRARSRRRAPRAASTRRRPRARRRAGAPRRPSCRRRRSSRRRSRRAGHAALLAAPRRARARRPASAPRGCASTSAAVRRPAEAERSALAASSPLAAQRQQHVRRLGRAGRARGAGRDGDAREVERGHHASPPTPGNADSRGDDVRRRRGAVRRSDRAAAAAPRGRERRAREPPSQPCRESAASRARVALASRAPRPRAPPRSRRSPGTFSVPARRPRSCGPP